jgi:UDP-glucose 4-epimerase
VFVSTSEVYGKRTDAPFDELDDVIFGNPYKLRWGYAVNKFIGEQLVNSLSMIDDIPTVIPRLFNVIGKRQTGKYGMVVPRFIEQAKNNEPLTIFGDGEQTRSFTYIDDVVDALWKLTILEGEHPPGGVFNIGTTEEVSINQLADMVIEQTGSQSEKIYIPYVDAYNTFYEDCPRRVPKLDRINEAIGWKPTTSLTEAIDKITQ